MALAETLTDIANLALATLGERQIQNLDADAAPAPTVRALMHESIRQVQQDIKWPELIVTHSPQAYPELYDEDALLYQYYLPTNFISIIELKSGYNWQIINNRLVTGDFLPTMLYKRSSFEPSEWSDFMVELIYKLNLPHNLHFLLRRSC